MNNEFHQVCQRFARAQQLSSAAYRAEAEAQEVRRQATSEFNRAHDAYYKALTDLGAAAVVAAGGTKP